MRYAGDRMKYTKVKPKRFDNLLVITKDELEDLKKGLPIQRKGYNIKITQNGNGLPRSSPSRTVSAYLRNRSI